MLWAVPVLAGFGCVAALRNARRSSEPEAMTLAWSVAAIAIVANAAWYCDAMWLLPVMDLYAGCMALTYGRSKKWVALFIDAVAVRLILHMLDALTGHSFLVAYIHALNATFAWMLLVVATGGHNGRSVSDYLRDLLRRLRRMGRAPAHSLREMNDGR